MDVLLQLIKMQLLFHSYKGSVRTMIRVLSCWSEMEANDCVCWDLQNIVSDFGLFQHWTEFENSFSPCLVYIFTATVTACYCQKVVINTNSQGNDSLLFRFLKGLTALTFLELQVL